MSRIESIKERNNEGINGDIYEAIGQSHADVEYLLQRLERYREALEYSTVYLEEITSKFNLTTSLHSDSLKRIRLNKEALKE